MLTLAQIADLHIPLAHGPRARDLLGKRFLGWLSWRLKRVHVFREEILEGLVEELRAYAPDHIAVTGDLTNLALESEFVNSLGWLERFGRPDRVSVVPGNHDACVPVPMARSWQYWATYMRADIPAGTCVQGIEDFPTLRVWDDVALLGLCSAQPTAPFLASGSLGAGQLRRLEDMLESSRCRGRCRVLQIHHSPDDVGVSWRRRLRDSAALRAVLGRAGAELVIHAHLHRASFGSVPGSEGPIPVVGVRSGSSAGYAGVERAQYHSYHIERVPGGSFRIEAVVREWNGEKRRFQTVATHELATGERSAVRHVA